MRIFFAILTGCLALGASTMACGGDDDDDDGNNTGTGGTGTGTGGTGGTGTGTGGTGTGTGGAGSGADACAQAVAKAESCGVTVTETCDPTSASDLCGAACVVAAPCAELEALEAGNMAGAPTLMVCAMSCMGSGDMFTCDDGDTIPADWVCDGDEDCDDGSDEVDCA